MQKTKGTFYGCNVAVHPQYYEGAMIAGWGLEEEPAILKLLKFQLLDMADFNTELDFSNMELSEDQMQPIQLKA